MGMAAAPADHHRLRGRGVPGPGRRVGVVRAARLPGPGVPLSRPGAGLPVIALDALLGAGAFFLIVGACTAAWGLAAALVLAVRYFLRR